MEHTIVMQPIQLAEWITHNSLGTVLIGCTLAVIAIILAVYKKR